MHSHGSEIFGKKKKELDMRGTLRTALYRTGSSRCVHAQYRGVKLSLTSRVLTALGLKGKCITKDR